MSHAGRDRLRGRIALPPEKIRVSAWVEQENRDGGHICACGCGKAIRVLPQHRAKGIPRYLRAHHPMAMTQESHRLCNEGLLTATAVARELGIGATTLRRLEGKLFRPVRRRGTRQIRVFTAEQVEQIRKSLQQRRP